MKKFRNFFIFSALSLITCGAFVACGDDDGNDDSNTTTGKVDGGVTPSKDVAMDETQQKQYIEQIGKELLAQVPASDFKSFSDLGHYVSETYLRDYDWSNVENWAKDIFDAARKSIGLNSKPSDSYSQYTDYRLLLYASSFKGHFKAVNGAWVQSQANDLQFVFNDQNGVECVLKLTTSGNEKKVHVAKIVDYTGYDWDGDGYITYYDRSELVIGIPEKVVVTLTKDGSNLLTTTLNVSLSSLQGEEFDLSKSGCTLTMTTELNNGYKIELSNVAYTANKKASATFTTSKGNRTLVSLAIAADVSGIPSCNVSAFSDKHFDLDDYNTEDATAKNAYVKFDILGKIQIQGTLTDVRQLCKLIDEANHNEENESKYKQSVKKINELFNVFLYYDGKSVKQANVKLEPFEKDRYYYKEWYVEPVIEFYDGSSYSLLTSFFNEDDFSSLINSAKRLADDYRGLVEK